MDMISTDLLILRSIHWIKTEQQMPSAPIYCWFSVDFMYEMPYNAHTQNIVMACFNLNDIVNLSLQWSTTLIHIVNKTNIFLFQTQAERCSLFLVDRKQQELVAKVFDGNMLPDGTVEVGMMRMLRVLMRMRIKVVLMMVIGNHHTS